MAGKSNVVADCLSRMTCNVEDVPKSDCLGTSLLKIQRVLAVAAA